MSIHGKYRNTKEEKLKYKRRNTEIQRLFVISGEQKLNFGSVREMSIYGGWKMESWEGQRGFIYLDIFHNHTYFVKDMDK